MPQDSHFGSHVDVESDQLMDRGNLYYRSMGHTLKFDPETCTYERYIPESDPSWLDLLKQWNKEDQEAWERLVQHWNTKHTKETDTMSCHDFATQTAPAEPTNRNTLTAFEQRLIDDERLRSDLLQELALLEGKMSASTKVDQGHLYDLLCIVRRLIETRK